MDNNMFKTALVQMSMSDRPEENIKKAGSMIKQGSDNGAKVVCLPELFMTRYFCQIENIAAFDHACSVSGEYIKKFSKIAADCSTVLIVPFFEKRASGIYHNSVAVIDSDGSVKGTYRKMHIPDDPGYYEKFYFTPGDEGYKSFSTSSGDIGTLICWDQWFPEAARIVSLKGANIIFYPTAIGWHPDEKKELGENQLEAWKTVQRGHAISNGVYVAAANRVGFEENDSGSGIEFWGNSFICDPQGHVICEASRTEEQILYAEIDLNKLENIRRNWPFLRDRRIDSYQDLNKRFLDKESG